MPLNLQPLGSIAFDLGDNVGCSGHNRFAMKDDPVDTLISLAHDRKEAAVSGLVAMGFKDATERVDLASDVLGQSATTLQLIQKALSSDLTTHSSNAHSNIGGGRPKFFHRIVRLHEAVRIAILVFFCISLFGSAKLIDAVFGYGEIISVHDNDVLAISDEGRNELIGYWIIHGVSGWPRDQISDDYNDRFLEFYHEHPLEPFDRHAPWLYVGAFVGSCIAGAILIKKGDRMLMFIEDAIRLILVIVLLVICYRAAREILSGLFGRRRRS